MAIVHINIWNNLPDDADFLPQEPKSDASQKIKSMTIDNLNACASLPDQVKQEAALYLYGDKFPDSVDEIEMAIYIWIGILTRVNMYWEKYVFESKSDAVPLGQCRDEMCFDSNDHLIVLDKRTNILHAFSMNKHHIVWQPDWVVGTKHKLIEKLPRR